MPEPEVYLRKWFLNTTFLSQWKHNALHYKWELVNAISGNSRCLFRKSHKTQKHINTEFVGKMRRILKQVTNIVTFMVCTATIIDKYVGSQSKDYCLMGYDVV
jgi:hypothetical protein